MFYRLQFSAFDVIHENYRQFSNKSEELLSDLQQLVMEIEIKQRSSMLQFSKHAEFLQP